MKTLVYSLIISALLIVAAKANIADFSVNQPSFPPGGLTLLETVNANANRRNITVQNQDVNLVEIWRDQTCSGSGMSLVILGVSAATGGQGGAWSSNTFTGCLRIYGTAGSQIAIYTN